MSYGVQLHRKLLQGFDGDDGNCVPRLVQPPVASTGVGAIPEHRARAATRLSMEPHLM